MSTTFTIDEIGELASRLKARSLSRAFLGDTGTDMATAARLLKHLITSGELAVCGKTVMVDDGEG